MQLNSTSCGLVLKSANRRAELPEVRLVLTVVTLGGLTCQENVTPSSEEEHCSSTTQPVFEGSLGNHTWVCMIGAWRRPAKVWSKLLNRHKDGVVKQVQFLSRLIKNLTKPKFAPVRILTFHCEPNLVDRVLSRIVDEVYSVGHGII